ncbi:MAG TPA: hypothetical protein VFB27_06435 [Opitutaceae bacterium]|nr:hypothetical protein [Opitutaceae bacterium]
MSPSPSAPPLLTAEKTALRRPRAERVITVVPRAGETLADVVRHLAKELRECEAVIGLMMVYGAVAARDQLEGLLVYELGPVDWPVLYVEGAGCANPVLAGIQVFALDRREPLQRIMRHERVVGTVFCDDDARHCLLGGLAPADPTAARPEQAQNFFEAAQDALQHGGFAYGDLARTWFYNDDILAWYGDFNRVRTAFYARQAFHSGSVPASTGIRGRNPHRTALTFAGWAVIPTGGRAAVREVASPLQGPAPAYGSSFSRAMEIISGGWKRLLISGTASIAPDGKTLWAGDTRKQIDQTMAVVEAILRSRKMTLGDTTRATAYFKHAGEAGLFTEWCAARALGRLPVVAVHADICRADLQFEIELDAAVPV